MRRRWKYMGALGVAGIILSVILVWAIGGVLVAPANRPILAAPENLHAEDVEFVSTSGATVRGWFIAGKPGQGGVVLMHGVHADRTTLLPRAEFLAKAGYAVLLFDFQGHGASGGKHITFGYLESRDATAAVNFMRQRLPGEKIGVIGLSMGAAAAQLANPSLPVNAMILESSYPTIYQAAEDRMVERFGWLGRMMTPLLTCQLKPRLGIGLEDLRPIDCVAKISAPKFFIAGTADWDTTFEESKALFAAAAAPKQSWWIEGAGHVDMHRFAGSEYEKRVLAFLALNLRS